MAQKNSFRTHRRKLNTARNLARAAYRALLRHMGAQRLAHEGAISASERFVKEIHASEASI
jgi:hypothetical protein